MRTAAVDATRRNIIKAASSLFAQQGIDQTNVRQIAKKAKISAGTLHYHFPSKAELVEELIVKAIRTLNAEAERIVAGDDHPREQLRKLAELLFDAFDRDWNTHYVALVLGDELRAQRPDDFPTTTGQFVELVSKGQQGGLVREGDPVFLGVLCHGLLLRVARGRVFGEIKRPLSAYEAEVAEACWRVLTAEE